MYPCNDLLAGGVRNFENDENECRRQYGDGSEIVQLYADDASLLATLSDKVPADCQPN